MLFPYFIPVIALSLSGATPTVTPDRRANPSTRDTIPAADTTSPVITTEVAKKMMAVLRATAQWHTSEARSRLTLEQLVPNWIEMGNVGGAEAQAQGMQFPLPDMKRLADSVPAAAQALKNAGLSAAQYLAFHRAFVNAAMTVDVDRIANGTVPKFTDTTTVLGKNVAFIRANPATMDELRSLGLHLPDISGHRTAAPATTP